MKINRDSDFKIEAEDSMESTINQEDLDIVMYMTGTSLYSDGLGSLIREISTNAVDSHIEAEIPDDPFIVARRYDTENDCWWLDIQDVGVGLSVKRIVTIYKNYFASTKRHTNKLHGAIGIGAKSPLSYQECFYITTIYNNIEYKYIFSKGEKRPQLDSLYGYETKKIIKVDTDGNEITTEIKIPRGKEVLQHNGTTISVEIKQGDFTLVAKKVNEQLCYFDNAYFKFQDDISNSYTIFEGKSFKFRNNIEKYTSLHLVIDKVRYPLKEGYDINYSVPLALKFDVGELDVTPNREQVNYTDRTNKAIESKIIQLKEEIKTLYFLDRPSINDFDLYLAERENLNSITFGRNTEYECSLNINRELIPLNNFKFQGNIVVPNTNLLLYQYKKIGRIYSEKDYRKEYHESYITYSELQTAKNTIVVNSKHIDKYMIHMLYEIYGNCMLVLYVPLSKLKPDKIYSIFKSMDKYYYVKGDRKYLDFNAQSYKREKLDNYKDYKINEDTGESDVMVPSGDKYKDLYTYYKFIQNHTKKQFKYINNVEITNEDVKRIDHSYRMEDPAYRRRISQQIIVRNLRGYRETVTLQELYDSYLVFYTVKDDGNNINDFKNLLESRDVTRKGYNRANKKNCSFGGAKSFLQKKDIRYIEIAKSNLKHIDDFSKFINVGEVHTYIMHKGSLLNKIFTRMFKIYGTKLMLEDMGYHANYSMLDVSKYYYNLNTNIINKYYHNTKTYIIEENQNYIRTICSIFKLYDTEVIEDAKKVLLFYKRINGATMGISNIGNLSIQAKRRILYDSGILRLDTIYYKNYKHEAKI